MTFYLKQMFQNRRWKMFNNTLTVITREEAFKNDMIVDITNVLIGHNITLDSIFKGNDSIVLSEQLSNYFSTLQKDYGLDAFKLITYTGLSFLNKVMKMRNENTPILSKILLFEIVIETEKFSEVVPLKAITHTEGKMKCLTFTFEHEQ